MLGKFKLVLHNLLANLFDPRQRRHSCTLLRRHVSTLGSATKKAEYGAFLAPVIPDSADSIRATLARLCYQKSGMQGVFGSSHPRFHMLYPGYAVFALGFFNRG